MNVYFLFFSRYVWLFSTRILSSHSSMSGIHLLKVFIVEDHLQSQLHKVSPEELLLLQETLKLGISKLGAKLQMYNQDSSPCHKLTNASLCVLQSFTSSLLKKPYIPVAQNSGLVTPLKTPRRQGLANELGIESTLLKIVIQGFIFFSTTCIERNAKL